MGNDGNGKREMRNSSTQQQFTELELAVMMKSQAYRLAVVLQPSLLC